MLFFFFSSRRRHTRWPRDWSSDVCSSDLQAHAFDEPGRLTVGAVPVDDAAGGPFVAEEDVLRHREVGAETELLVDDDRSEERRVGKEGRCRGAPERWRDEGRGGGGGAA